MSTSNVDTGALDDGSDPADQNETHAVTAQSGEDRGKLICRAVHGEEL